MLKWRERDEFGRELLAGSGHGLRLRTGYSRHKRRNEGSRQATPGVLTRCPYEPFVSHALPLSSRVDIRLPETSR